MQLKIFKVLLPGFNMPLLNYFGNPKLEVGDLVIVPLRQREVLGVIWECASELQFDPAGLKTIKVKVPLEYKLHPDVIKLIGFVGSYYCNALSIVAKLVIPVDILQKPFKFLEQQVKVDDIILPLLSDEQNKAFIAIKSGVNPSILKGVTGSGKTEVYFHLIKDYLAQGKQIVLLLPEISLSNQIIGRFVERFGFEPAIWNSKVTTAQKKKILRGVLANTVKIVIGARSSLLLPYPNLGLVIVDEEHDPSYKQEEGGAIYHARDIAVYRTQLSNAKVVLGSATPSSETIYNYRQGKYNLVELQHRYNDAMLPHIELIDMRSASLPEGSWLSAELIQAMRETIARREQVLLFLNRRGYAPLMLCKACGYRFNCPACTTWLVVHKKANRLECHHCGYHSTIPHECLECHDSDSLMLCGPGVERIADEVKNLLPDSKVVVLSRDHILQVAQITNILEEMQQGKIDVLIGTQIVTKGYHFPNLTLVGVIDADLSFAGADLRASERTYQLLSQVGGRAGRADKSGKVLIQTYYPDNVLLNNLKNAENEAFIAAELATRQASKMPPFTRLASILLVGENESYTCNVAKNIVAQAPRANKENLTILGPAACIIHKIANKYRYRILLIANRKFNVQQYINAWLSAVKIPGSVQCRVNIDPQNFN